MMVPSHATRSIAVSFVASAMLVCAPQGRSDVARFEQGAIDLVIPHWGEAIPRIGMGLGGTSALEVSTGAAIAWERSALNADAPEIQPVSTHRLMAYANENDFRLGQNGVLIGYGDAALTAFADGTAYYRIEENNGRVLEFATPEAWLDPANAVRDHGICFAGTRVRCAYARPGAYMLQLSSAVGSFVANDIIRFPTVADLVAGTNSTVIANGASQTIDAVHSGAKVYKIDANGDLQSGTGDSIYNITKIGAFHLGTNFTAAFSDGASFYVQHPWQYTSDAPTDAARVRKLSSFHLRLSDPDASPPVTPAETLRVVLHVGANGLSALDGDGMGGGTWHLLAPTQSDRFHRISILEDHLACTYEVHLDSVRIAADLGFKNRYPISDVSFTRLEADSTVWIDNVAETQWLEGPVQDSDGDGADDAAEWTAGTDAADPADVLRLGLQSAAAALGGQPIASWQTRPGRAYSLEASGDLGTWIPLTEDATPSDGSPIQRTLHPPIGADRWFLRLKVAHP
jgi:hypothetical protein